ncbi:MAG TPA: hypothetical protein VNE58_07165 [Casimicrobiaceae bacterium]|nr:hypothetical protein [Casimicrobiaceae bacterium]
MPPFPLPAPLRRVIDDDAQLNAWNERRLADHEVLRIVRSELPRPIAERLNVIDASGGSLVLGTTAAAVAAVARQRGPDMLRALARDGHAFRSVDIRVRPLREAGARAQHMPRSLDRESARPLAVLEAGLPDGPLKVALRRLLKRR